MKDEPSSPGIARSSLPIQNLKFKIYHSLPLILAAALCCFLLAMEFAIPAWRNNVPPSTAPVFSLPMANDAIQNAGDPPLVRASVMP